MVSFDIEEGEGDGACRQTWNTRTVLAVGAI